MSNTLINLFQEESSVNQLFSKCGPQLLEVPPKDPFRSVYSQKYFDIIQTLFVLDICSNSSKCNGG